MQTKIFWRKRLHGTRCLQIQSCWHSGLTENYIYIYTAQNFELHPHVKNFLSTSLKSGYLVQEENGK